ncbi:DUF983 domain-containing protein [Phaeovulum sp.]|uniref:DUF983 domain-containing protein n=1 Tax=Phaeovulum sp. TaxID=2934796 RepID=UPI0039E2BA2D
MTDISPDLEDDRPMGNAVWRGLACRCPACGKGALLRSYLKVHDNCPTCGETFSHHRADDGPAYLTILIVGHLMAPLILWAFITWRPEPMTMIAIFATGTLALSLLLLPRLKGMIVGIQWSRRMHGFGPGPDARDD